MTGTGSVAALPAPRLYFDEDAHGQLARVLRREGWSIETTAEVGRLESEDEGQPIYAVSRRSTLVTHNIRHFLALHAQWVGAGRTHYRIIVLIGHSAVGTWLRRMRSLFIRMKPEDLQGQLIFLGAEYD